MNSLSAPTLSPGWLFYRAGDSGRICDGLGKGKKSELSGIAGSVDP